jgi:fatty acid-binding protein DegV
MRAAAVMSSPPAPEVATVRARVSEALPGAEIVSGTVGPVVGTHVGPGLMAVGLAGGPAFD